MESSIELTPILKNLGVSSVFDPSTADFSGIFDSAETIAVSDVMHRARISVDENGTEAAAVTAVAWALAEPGEPPKPIPFIVNRPFLFLIRDDITGAILFLGRMINPSSSY